MTQGIGPLETQGIAYFQSRTNPQVASGDLVRDLQWTAVQERKVLSQLSRKGFIARIRRGLYLAPRRLAIGGKWTPGEMLTLVTLMQDCGGTYQISGPNVFQRYGWTEQISNRIYAYNNRLTGDRQIGPVSLSLIKVADNRLGGTESVWTPDGLEIIYANRARALVDAVYDWSRFDTLPRAYGWIAREVAKNDALVAELTEVTIRYGNQGTLRRIGATLERLGVQEGLLRRLERSLRNSSSFIPMIPTASKRGRPATGKTSKRWKVVYNDE